MAQRPVYADLVAVVDFTLRFKGARDVRYTMWVSMLGMGAAGWWRAIPWASCWGWGVIGVWLGMVLDWAVRGVLFYFRMVSGRWLWKYPRVKASSEES